MILPRTLPPEPSHQNPPARALPPEPFGQNPPVRTLPPEASRQSRPTSSELPLALGYWSALDIDMWALTCAWPSGSFKPVSKGQQTLASSCLTSRRARAWPSFCSKKAFFLKVPFYRDFTANSPCPHIWCPHLSSFNLRLWFDWYWIVVRLLFVC